jgi:uncharacterized protein with FMN-binding domain
MVALSSAAVLAVYAAGYQRTRQAADRFEAPRRRAETVPDTSAPLARTGPAPTALPPVAEDARPLPPGSTPPPDRTRSAAAPVASTAKQGAQVKASTPPVATDATRDLAASAPPAGPVTPIAETPLAASVPAPSVEPAPAVAAHEEPRLKDGTFLGWGSCRHGDIQASVVIEDGRITSTSIAQCLTRYSCKWIEGLLTQVVDRQTARVDVVSGATESTEAFEDAVLDALAKAK